MSTTKLKIAYLTSSAIPSKTANSIHVMKMCESWGLEGHSVELIVPDSANIRRQIEDSVENVYDYYGVSQVFRIKRVLEYNFLGTKYIYGLELSRYLKTNRVDLIYSRDLLLSAVLVSTGLEVVYEAHFAKIQDSIPSKWFYQKLKGSPKLLKIISITHALKKEMKGLEWPNDKIEVVPDAASSPTDLNSKSIHSGQFIVGYLGHLYPGKGMEVISRLAPMLPGVEFHVVGGKSEDINFWKKEISVGNIKFHGFIPQADISPFLNSFDCCLLPNQRFVKTSAGGEMDIGGFTSPLKMFDYLAHGKPIIASDLKVLKEVLTSDIAIFCDPKEIGEWKNAVQLLQRDINLRCKMGDKAKSVFDESYSWKKRAALVLNKLKIEK